MEHKKLLTFSSILFNAVIRLTFTHCLTAIQFHIIWQPSGDCNRMTYAVYFVVIIFLRQHLKRWTGKNSFKTQIEQQKQFFFLSFWIVGRNIFVMFATFNMFIISKTTEYFIVHMWKPFFKTDLVTVNNKTPNMCL